ncbi:calcium-binding protein [Pseudaestuariivita atlantica]|uniref:calcium-binding protein n=1 Tax=Pseudaestuariivita atlantica TaxID=1317121 RepID=UPI00067E48D3|nr:calcium-binding protein [Pseudaestuariivita atlantica]
MARLDFTDSVVFVQITTNRVAYTSTEASSGTLFRWLVDTGGTFDVSGRALGTGITVDGDGFPTGGTITSIQLDTLYRGTDFDPSIFITEISVALTDLIVLGTLEEQTNAFWTTLQSGDDLIIAPSQSGWLFGDALAVRGTEELTGGNDTLRATQTETSVFTGYTLQGDVDQISGDATLTGGHDVIEVDSPTGEHDLSGDVWFAAGATLIGGDDRITIIDGGVESRIAGEATLQDGDTSLTGGNDTLTGSPTVGDRVFGEVEELLGGTFTGGNDLLNGRGGDDTLAGDIGTLSGGTASGGNDTLNGGPGDDILHGDVGVIDGGTLTMGGDDVLNGGAGNDTITGGGGANAIDGGPGEDLLDFSNATGRAFADLQIDQRGAGFLRFYDEGQAAGDTYAGLEHITGGAFSDNLRGDAGGNRLEGGGVTDRLYGRAGDDTLDGGTGADAFYGGLGVDLMTGGDDAGRRDRFIYFSAGESGVGPGNRDVITDFTPGEDRIELSRIDADLTQGFKQGFQFIGTSAFSGTGGELRIEQTEGITLVQADRDGDGAADFEIELTGNLSLSATDFLI